jgi:hypothetical protein
MKYAAKKKCAVIVARMNMTKNSIINPWKDISLTAKTALLNLFHEKVPQNH